VYAVPSTDVGDEVMVALHLLPDAAFDPAAFVAFLDEQADFSPKWTPRFVRVSDGLPSTATQKVLKRVLRQEHWECDDAVWWRPGRAADFRRLDADDVAALRAQFVAREREHLIGR
jgi:fatty-acyl-CoA synthase